VSRPRKSLLKVYLLWLLLGGLGAHRFYLGRPGAGLMYALIGIGGAALYSTGVTEANERMQLVGIIAGGMVAAGLLVDLFMIPGMVERLNNPGREGGSFILPGANLDPSFQATVKRAGLEERPERPRKSRIPEGYVMPWRQDDATPPEPDDRPDDED